MHGYHYHIIKPVSFGRRYEYIKNSSGGILRIESPEYAEGYAASAYGYKVQDCNSLYCDASLMPK